jgi:hypothetical protein
MELLSAYVAEFRGGFPDVPFAPDVDVAGLRADDPDPLFVTLPIVRVGVKSGNGLTWSETDARHLVNEINTRKPEGINGHVTAEQRASRYDLPRLRWLGAELVGDMVYAKAYVPQYASDMREHFRLAKRTNAPVGTSVYGLRGERGLGDMTLESIDVGHPARVSSRDAAAVPRLTSEFTTGDNNVTEPNEALVSELRTDRDTARNQVAELQTTLKDKEKLVTELTASKSTLDTLISELSLGDDAVTSARAIVAELRTLRTASLVRSIDDVLVSEVKAEPMRPVIRKFLVSAAGVPLVADVDAAKVVIAEQLADPIMQSIAQKLVVEYRGGAAIVGKGGDAAAFVDTPEARRAATAWMGI